MPEIQTILEALTLVTYAILALLSIVIAVGILNMYRVIIYERTREIGTMRAIGVQKHQVRNIVLCEAFFLAICGIAAGLILSVLGLFILSRFSMSGAAGFDIFLDRRHLSWVIYPDVVGPGCASDRSDHPPWRLEPGTSRPGDRSNRGPEGRMNRSCMDSSFLLDSCVAALADPFPGRSHRPALRISSSSSGRADSLVTFLDSDFSAMYTFVQDIPGQGSSCKQAMVFRRDRENTYLIVITKPEEDKGKGYLKSGQQSLVL